jgi:hypothetical protein
MFKASRLKSSNEIPVGKANEQPGSTQNPPANPLASDSWSQYSVQDVGSFWELLREARIEHLH